MRPNILIVDDSPVMRRFISRVLDATTLEPGQRLEAGNGQEAIDILTQYQGGHSGAGIDLVLADINMPVMDGPSLVRAMQADPRWKQLPVLVISTDRSEARMEEMQDLGVAGYVVKPFSPGQLEEKIVGALESAARHLGGFDADRQYPVDPSMLLPEMIGNAVREVLESMCFLPVTPVEDADADSVDLSGVHDPAREGNAIAARLSFSGPFHGSLMLVAEERALLPMAANFLGEEEESICIIDHETVLLEMANMLCGAVLHAKDAARLFTLASPELIRLPDRRGAAPAAPVWQHFLVADGWLSVAFHAELPGVAH